MNWTVSVGGKVLGRCEDKATADALATSLADQLSADTWITVAGPGFSHSCSREGTNAGALFASRMAP